MGSKACSGCHENIYDDFLRTGMGRSMSLGNNPSELERVPVPVTIFASKFKRYFQVFRKDSNLYQSEYELDDNRNLVFTHTEKIEYVIGSGVNGFSYIVQRSDYLFEAPLSFYSKSKTWGLSPGYRSEDFGFSRPIAAACVVCHSGRPQLVGGRDGLYKNPPFRELSVGCENCHGPGQLHFEERLKGVPLSGDRDLSIVNPAKLPAWLADNICMYCHQGGDIRVLKPGRDYSDFRPGTPLDDTMVILKVPPKSRFPAESPLLEHYFSMILSSCYRASGGRLSCLSCHNPHHEPSPPEAVAYYREKCLNCHAQENCALPLENRLRENPRNDCAGCHMPKKDVRVVSHSSLTQHRIIPRKTQPYPEIALSLTTPTESNLVHLNAVPGKEKVPVPPLALFEAYITLLRDSHPDYQAAYLALLNQLAASEPRNALVLSALAQKMLWEGTHQGESTAIRYLSQAIELGSTSPSDYHLLAELLARAGRVPEAIQVLQSGIRLAPFDAAFYRSLALDYMATRNFAGALEALKQGLRLFPEDSKIRTLLKKAEAANPTW